MPQLEKTSAWFLRIDRPGEARQERPVAEGLCIGRSAPNASNSPDISISDPRVSREHLRFGLDASGLWVLCTGKNGVDLNGQNVNGRHVLNSGDVLRLFELTITVELRAKPADAAPAPVAAPVKRNTRMGLLIALSAAVAACGVAALVGWGGVASGDAPAKKQEQPRKPVAQEIRPEVLRAKALDEARLARKLGEERNILPENRFACLGHYRNALGSMKSLPDTAGLCSLWRADSALIAGELDSIFEDHRKKALVAFRQNKPDLSQEYLENVMQLYPDPGHPRYQWAKKNLLVVGKAGPSEADN